LRHKTFQTLAISFLILEFTLKNFTSLRNSDYLVELYIFPEQSKGSEVSAVKFKLFLVLNS